ncbi:12533_t:CDS:2, partial [Dentiscutata erythropus]
CRRSILLCVVVGVVITTIVPMWVSPIAHSGTSVLYCTTVVVSLVALSGAPVLHCLSVIIIWSFVSPASSFVNGDA